MADARLAVAAGPSRSQRIRLALAAEVDRRAAQIDGDDDLISVTLTVKFHKSSGDVRAVLYSPTSEWSG